MNPFELQAELMRQWLGMANALTAATLSACNNLAHQSAAAMSRAAPTPVSGSSPWPFGMWPSFGTPQAGMFPMINPFMPSAGQPAWPMLPWASMMGWPPSTASPMQAFAPMMQMWSSPWTAMLSQPPWWLAPSRPRDPGAELIEQVASTYRTASGYAVAAVMGPFGATLDPRTFGQPWWQTYPARRLS